MIFGLYPGGISGAADGSMARGAPDDPERIHSALDLLHGDITPFLIRCYSIFNDDTAEPTDTTAPLDAAHYLAPGRQLDLVLQYQSRSTDIDGYVDYVRRSIDRYGRVSNSIQIGEEPNVRGNATLDGDYPGVEDAVVAAAIEARLHSNRSGLEHLRIGINTTPLFGDSTSYLRNLCEHGGQQFRTSLDYVGLDMFPDVFVPVPVGRTNEAVSGLLKHHRENVMRPAGLGELPLRITENGWPTAPDRSYAAQSSALESIIDAVMVVSDELNIEAYELFSLRDADSAGPGIFHTFGIMTDQYVAKPAFETYRRTIARWSSPRGDGAGRAG